MNAVLIGIIAAGIVVAVAIFVWTLFKRTTAHKVPDQWILLLQNQLGDLARVVDQKLGSVDQKVLESARAMQQQMQQQFGESTRIIKEITQELVRVGEGQKQVMTVTEQLQNLQDILKNPKQRGVLGEYYLQAVLENVLPPGSYQMQYEFSDGMIVDAVIFVKDKIIPVDSKFSLENYNRIIHEHDAGERERLEKLFKQDLKNRIDETAKYVKPEEKTMDFAFMFIPAEAIYYDLLVNQVGAVKTNTRDLVEYAFSRKVIVVSPTSFLAYLQTVLQGLRALQIEESAKEIRKRVEELGKHLLSYEDFMTKVGKNLAVTVNAFNGAQKEFKKIDKDVLRISGSAVGITEPRVLEKPEENV